MALSILRTLAIVSSCVMERSTAFVLRTTFKRHHITTITTPRKSKSLLQMTMASNITSASSYDIQKPIVDDIISEDMDNEWKMNKIKRRIVQTRRRMPTYDPTGPVRTITTIEGFLDALGNSPPNGLVIVKYHAKFCKVCARVIIKYKKLADRLSSAQTPVPITFTDVEITANRDLCSTLGIKKFPFVQIYRNMECVASFGTGPAHNFKKVVDGSINEKLLMTDEDWNKFRTEFETEILDNLIKIDQLSLKTALGLETCEVDGYIGDDLLP